MTAGTVTADALTTPGQVRERLVDALELDLVGPGPGHVLEHELLPGERRPSQWYLTGFLIPTQTAEKDRGDLDEQDDVGGGEAEEGLAEESSEERTAAKRGYFPSSMGLSALVGPDARELAVDVRWGDYVHDQLEREDARPRPVWRRIPREAQVTVALGAQVGHPHTLDVPGSGGLGLTALERAVDVSSLEAGDLPAGTRSVSLFLVNDRRTDEDPPDPAYVFQPVLTVAGDRPFVARPDLRGAYAEDQDERLADLHYADAPEYATGHGVAADWTTVDDVCFELRTRWIPVADVAKTSTVAIEGVELSMAKLGVLADAADAHAALDPIVTHYREWIAEQRVEATALTGRRRETAEALVAAADHAAGRIEAGIAALAADPDALDAFRVANRAVGAALAQRLQIAEPGWRPFQLAFILLNLPGIVDSADPERETVDLLFFPTGGGKTEAYLGLAAFTLVLRRLRHPAEEGRVGAGVSVVMRYTLRLLTLDQLARAAGLVCALELERESDPGRYGTWPFEIGLWVGRAAVPNLLGRKGDGKSGTARQVVAAYKNDPSKPIPIPLEDCPWCRTGLTPDSFSLWPTHDRPTRLRVCCTDPDCAFSGQRSLPIVAVDEELYRRLPAFLIATVDKFATLPWTGVSGALLGGASRADDGGFYGAAETGRGTRLSAALGPPDLVIQDELHLISGPLGTMAGLYETAIDGLCRREVDGVTVRPKVVASTATVRRAGSQVQALFGRAQTDVFPPPGVTRHHSFFARTDTAADPRRYVGVAAQGRNPKVVMRRVWLALMAAAGRCYFDAGGTKAVDNPADGYMTLLGYFNSLRELGGARRILEEEIPNTIKEYGSRRRIVDDPGYFASRPNLQEPVELTSRVTTAKVANARRRLGLPASDKERVDTAIATNMISVGLDIPRLGLMGVLGQPKTASEYIQATSRVGRDKAPGLVVTVLNIHKPRDRSHFERFRHFHATFYRAVEVASVTPFSARALDRGLVGAVVALSRHLEPSLTPARGVEGLASVRVGLEQRLRALFLERLDEQDMEEDERRERAASVELRIVDLLDAWSTVLAHYASDGVPVQYQRYESDGPKPLLREMLDTVFEPDEQQAFRVNRSLRDVEPTVGLFVKEPRGGRKAKA